MRPPRGKQKLFDAALKLFAAQGYFTTTVEQITAEAGVSKGLVYNYFTSKEELLVALLEDATRRMTTVADRLQQHDELGACLARFIDDYLRFIQAERRFLRLQLSLMLMPELRETVARPQRERSEALLATVHGWFRRAGAKQAKNKARVFLAMLDGVALHHLAVYERYPLRSLKPQLVVAAQDLCARS